MSPMQHLKQIPLASSLASHVVQHLGGTRGSHHSALGLRMVREGGWVWGEGLVLAGTRDLEVNITIYSNAISQCFL